VSQISCIEVKICLLVRHKACKLTLLLQSGSVLHNGLRYCKLRQAACIFERSRLWTIHPTPSTGRSQDPLLHSPYIPQTLDMQLQRLGGDSQVQARKFPLDPLVKNMLPSGGEATSCVVMQHIHTRRLRKLYVFKTITKDKSLVSHPEHGIISNEAYILLGKLKTNLYPHPNIVQLFNCVTSNAIAGVPIHILQMEYCGGGDLCDLNNQCIKHGIRIPKSLITHIFISLSAALAYLHHGLTLTSSGSLEHKYLHNATNHWQPILHNDIKPENIFLRWPLVPSSSTSIYPDIVLADFGAAGVESHVKGPRGTYKYSAPEVKEAFNASTSIIRRFPFAAVDRSNNNMVLTTKSDIWGLGAVMRFLFVEYQRERGGREWEQTERALQWKELGAAYGESMVKWVRRCLGYRALGRPSARTLLGTAAAEIKGEARVGERVQRLPEWIWSRD
jgi:serine/threonine protein kinase